VEAIILAGGLGTRLGSRLNGIPKPMVQVAGRPFLEILIERLARSGFDRVILSVGHLASVISDHFGSSWRGVEIDYSVEQEALGTGGAVRKALEHFAGHDAFVLNGDTWLEVDYSAMRTLHRQSRACITLALTRVDDTARYGEVEVVNDRVASFIEKGRVGAGLINGGVYVMSREFPWPENLPAKFSFETDVLLPRLASLDHAVFLSDGRFIDIGVPEDLDRAQELGSRQ
jgi:D-glycero-alpha-D-manno-heptose 1-phosphate guanylyltransferase